MSALERQLFSFPVVFLYFLSLSCLCFAFSVRRKTPWGPGLFAQVVELLAGAAGVGVGGKRSGPGFLWLDEELLGFSRWQGWSVGLMFMERPAF